MNRPPSDQDWQDYRERYGRMIADMLAPHCPACLGRGAISVFVVGEQRCVWCNGTGKGTIVPDPRMVS